MPVIMNNEEYLDNDEATAYVGGVNSQTLRLRAKAMGIKRYKRGVAPNKVFYKKSDLDNMREFRPIEDDENSEG